MSETKVVPVEPTEEMIEAAVDAGWIDEEDVVETWFAMLAAAPSSEPTEVTDFNLYTSPMPAAQYQSDLEAAVAIVFGAGGITGHADTFQSLTAEWVDRMKVAEAKLARIGALVGKWTADELAQPDAGIGASQQPVRGGITCARELQAELEG